MPPRVCRGGLHGLSRVWYCSKSMLCTLRGKRPLFCHSTRKSDCSICLLLQIGRRVQPAPEHERSVPRTPVLCRAEHADSSCTAHSGKLLFRMIDLSWHSCHCSDVSGLQTLGLMHLSGVAHMDLSPRNIMVRHSDSRPWNKLCLVDFGCAHKFITGMQPIAEECIAQLHCCKPSTQHLHTLLQHLPDGAKNATCLDH